MLWDFVNNRLDIYHQIRPLTQMVEAHAVFSGQNVVPTGLHDGLALAGT
jgi:hypothetical protein